MSAPYVDYFIGTGVDSISSFGIALVAGDFNGDGYDDLAIGDADEADTRKNNAHGGGVWIIPGSRTGLVVDSTKHFNQSSPGLPGESENRDAFGASLAAGDINGDRRDDLAIGAFMESIGSVKEAGAVTILYGGSSGLTGTGAQQLHQNQAAVPGSAERRDHFGMSLAIGKVNNNKYADLAVRPEPFGRSGWGPSAAIGSGARWPC